MSPDQKKVKNPEYLWLLRIAFWAGLLFNIPMFFINDFAAGTALSNTIILLFHSYMIVGAYVLGHRLDTPPVWAGWLLPAKWIIEWRYLVYANPEAIKDNRKRLIRVIGAGALLTVLLLAILTGRL